MARFWPSLWWALSPTCWCSPPDGKRVLLANEGEPSDDYQIDPEGSVSIIEVPANPIQYLNYRDFGATPGTAEALDLGPEGVRFIAPEMSPLPGGPLPVAPDDVSLSGLRAGGPGCDANPPAHPGHPPDPRWCACAG